MGRTFHDHDGATTFAVIETVIPAETALGTSVHLTMSHRTWKEMLDRLEAKGLISSSYSNGSEARRGRAKRFFKLEPEGAKSLSRSSEILANMWRGLEPGPDLSKS